MTHPFRGSGRWLLRILGGVLALAVLALVALGVASVREGVSLRAQAVLLLARALHAKHTMQDVAAYRAAIREDRQRGEAPPPDALRERYVVRREALDGGAVYTLTPRAGTARRTLLYIHGGAYCGALNAMHWGLIERLGERSGARLVVPQYPLAPEHDWKRAYAMLDQLYQRLAAEVAPESIVIAGDSAGGGFTLGLAEQLRDEGRPLPGGLILYSPWLNLVRDNPAQAALEDRDPGLARAGLVWAAEHWADGTPLDDPHISPVLGSLKGLPPLLVFSGTRDLLNADAQQLVEKARQDGARLDYVEAPQMLHDWVLLPLPEARAAQERSVAFMLGERR